MCACSWVDPNQDQHNKFGEYLGFVEGTNSSDATVNYPQAMITSPVVDKANKHQL